VHLIAAHPVSMISTDRYDIAVPPKDPRQEGEAVTLVADEEDRAIDRDFVRAGEMEAWVDRP
jgi:hypothetical protein